MRRIILHAGTEKTGSTYLQSVFVKNRKLLKSAGVLYPVSGVESGHHYWLAKALGFKFKPGRVNKKKEDAALVKLKNEINAWSGDVLLSSEHFDLNVNGGTLERFRDYFSNEIVEVILVVRNQVDYSQSLYAEGLKWAAIRPYEQFLAVTEEQGRFSYLRRHELWQEIEASISFIDYEQCKNNLLPAFIDHANIKIDADKLIVPAVEQNVTPSIDFLEMVRICNVDREPECRRDFFECCYKKIKKNAPELLKGRRFSIPDKSIVIFERAQETNNVLANKLGVSVEEFLGGSLMDRMQDYASFHPPNALEGLKKFLPHLLGK